MCHVCVFTERKQRTLSNPTGQRWRTTAIRVTRPTILIPDRLVYIYTLTLQNQTSGGHIIGRISALNTRGKKKKKSYNNRADVKLKSDNREERRSYEEKKGGENITEERMKGN